MFSSWLLNMPTHMDIIRMKTVPRVVSRLLFFAPLPIRMKIMEISAA